LANARCFAQKGTLKPVIEKLAQAGTFFLFLNEGLLWVDAVEKVVDELGQALPFKLSVSSRSVSLSCRTGQLGAASNACERWTPLTLSGNACSLRVQRRPPDMADECLQVLRDGSEVELVARTGEATQPHALETVVSLQVRKAHLDPLALVT
jgi:hypothetical protein